MKSLISFALLLLSIGAFAEPCESEWKESATRQFTYVPVILSPGETFTVQNWRKFVMVRQPFMDFASGKRYAITFPVQFINSHGGFHESYDFTITSRNGEECSDIWIEGEKLISHSQMVLEDHEQSYFTAETHGARIWTMEHTIFLTTTMEFQIGQARGALRYYWWRYAGSDSGIVEPPESFDFSDGFDWDYFEERQSEGLNQLRTIARRVYITPLE